MALGFSGTAGLDSAQLAVDEKKAAIFAAGVLTDNPTRPRMFAAGLRLDGSDLPRAPVAGHSSSAGVN